MKLCENCHKSPLRPCDGYYVAHSPEKCYKCGKEGTFFFMFDAPQEVNPTPAAKIENRPKSKTARNLRAKLLKKSSSCHYCKTKLTEKIATIDHKIPLSKGGTNDIKNLLLACKDCNHDKGNMTYEEFIKKQEEHGHTIHIN